jgi:transcriptional regulator with XRE-family HTH domain
LIALARFCGMTLNPVAPLNARVPEWTFAERLRKVRRDLKWTQADMAARLDVKASTYEAWETGRNKPDIAELAEKLEAVTGITRLWFVGWADAGNPNGGPGGSNPRSYGYKPGFSLSPAGIVTPIDRWTRPGDRDLAA